MRKEFPKPQADHFDDDAGYETADVRPKQLLEFSVFLLIFVAAMFLVVWLIYPWFMSRSDEQQNMASSPAAHQVPPPPVLQTQPVLDLYEYKASQASSLENYAYVAGGNVRIPIDRAIDLAVDNNQLLPSRENGNKAPISYFGVTPVTQKPANANKGGKGKATNAPSNDKSTTDKQNINNNPAAGNAPATPAPDTMPAQTKP